MAEPEVWRKWEMVGRIAPNAALDTTNGRLGNLIVNAIRFRPRDGRIVLRAERAGDDVRCALVDGGPGIPADQLEKVFERFVQINANDRRGLGLGLFIAKRIVEGHSGKIWAESTVGQGTTVVFTIPFQAA